MEDRGERRNVQMPLGRQGCLAMIRNCSDGPLCIEAFDKLSFGPTLGA